LNVELKDMSTNYVSNINKTIILLECVSEEFDFLKSFIGIIFNNLIWRPQGEL